MPAADLKATIKVEVLKELPEKEHFDLEEKLENMISRLTEVFDHSFGGISNEKEIGRNTIAISEEIRKLTECLMMVKNNEVHSGVINEEMNIHEKLNVITLANYESTEEYREKVTNLSNELLEHCKERGCSIAEILDAFEKVRKALPKVPLK